MLADILPTGYEVGVLRPRAAGDVVAVVGAGPVGLAAIMGAWLFSPSHIVAIDLADRRLEAAKQLGADVTINNAVADPLATVRALTEGLGADVTFEAVGQPETFDLAVRLTRPGGTWRTSACTASPRHCTWKISGSEILTITTGLVDTYSTPTLLRLLASGQLDASKLVTHRFGFDDFDEAYDVFTRAADTGALKVVVTGERISG